MIILADMHYLRLCICLFHGVRTYHYVCPFHTIVSAQSIYKNCHNFDIISKYYTCTIQYESGKQYGMGGHNGTKRADIMVRADTMVRNGRTLWYGGTP